MSGANHPSPPDRTAIDPELAWSLLLEVRRYARRSEPLPDHFGVGLNARSQPSIVPMDEPSALLEIAATGSWVARVPATEAAIELLDLYLPLALANHGRPLTVAHLGQSLDGYIATQEGVSRYINGSENLTHLHRMRALCDAIVVGAGTVECDDPRLTTRRVPGPNPVRVVLDPRRRLAAGCNVFQDQAAPTVLICDETLADQAGPGDVRVIGVPRRGHRLDLYVILERLHAHGLSGIFVEGGGLTVSAFLEQGLLDRLQIAVAPLIIGSGRPGVTLPPIRDLAQGLRPGHRRYVMGEDVLFDCRLRDEAMKWMQSVNAQPTRREPMGDLENEMPAKSRINQFDFIEFPVRDLDQLRKTQRFFTSVFGWSYQEWSDDYSDTKGGGLSSGLNADPEHRPRHPLAVIYTADLESMREKVVAAGGVITKDIFSFPGGRRFHFQDPAGNELAIWSDRED